MGLMLLSSHKYSRLSCPAGLLASSALGLCNFHLLIEQRGRTGAHPLPGLCPTSSEEETHPEIEGHAPGGWLVPGECPPLL